MKTPPLAIFLATLLTALLGSGCETRSDRIREKSALYATLSPAQQAQIGQGIVAVGFTPEMVYMALGNPARLEKTERAEAPAELWIYNNYYPTAPDGHFRPSSYSTETPYQPSRYEAGTTRPRGIGAPQSIATTGAPQGQWSEPADLPSYTLIVAFTGGKVSRLGLRAR